MRCRRGSPRRGGQSIQVFPRLNFPIARSVVEFRRLKTLHSKVIYTGKFFKGDPMKTTAQVWSSQRWVEYFRSNKASLMVIPWELCIELSLQERRASDSTVHSIIVWVRFDS